MRVAQNISHVICNTDPHHPLVVPMHALGPKALPMCLFTHKADMRVGEPALIFHPVDPQNPKPPSGRVQKVSELEAPFWDSPS